MSKEYRITNFQLMVQLREAQLQHGHKPHWVYYKFIEGAQFEVTQKDFEKMAKLLGYEKGWAYYKYKDWYKDLTKLKREKAEASKIYARDNRCTTGLEMNKTF